MGDCEKQHERDNDMRNFNLWKFSVKDWYSKNEPDRLMTV